MTLGEFFILLLVGLVAGWLAGLLMRGGGYGVLGDILLGIVGAVLGGFLFGLLGIAAYGIPGRIAVALVGSIVIIALARVLRGPPARTSH